MEPYYNVTQMTDIRFVLEDVYELDKIEVHAEQHQIPLELRLHSHEDYWYDKMHPSSKVPFDAWEDMWKSLKLTSPREMREAMREADERSGRNIKVESVDHVKSEPLEESERRIKPEPLEEAERRIKPEPSDELPRRVSDQNTEQAPRGFTVFSVWDYPNIKTED